MSFSYALRRRSASLMAEASCCACVIACCWNRIAESKSPTSAYAAANVSVQPAYRQAVLAQAAFASARACLPFRKETSGHVARIHARAFNAQAEVIVSDDEAVMFASLS